jgi:hypothetical protein
MEGVIGVRTMTGSLIGGVLALLITLFLLAHWGTARAEGATTWEVTEQNSGEKKEAVGHGSTLTLLSVPGLSFADLRASQEQGLEHIGRIVHGGWAAAMNMRTAGKGLAAAYTALGAGRPAVAVERAQGFYHTELVDGLPARAGLQLYLGESPIQSTPQTQRAPEIVVPVIRSLDKRNQSGPHGAIPGLLGETLREARVDIFLWGNADAGFHPGLTGWGRQLALMLMDRQGVVPRGQVAGHVVLMEDAERPFGVRMNEAGFQDWRSSIRAEKALIGIEWGDLARLNRIKDNMAADRWDELRMNILRDLDQWIGFLYEGLAEGDALWVMSPQVDDASYKRKEQLAPLLIMAKGQMNGGVLWSPSTRREGIATFADLAPTMLRYYGVSAPREFAGFPLQEAKGAPVNDGLAWDRLQMELGMIRDVYTLRPFLLYSLVSFEAIVLVAGLGLWMLGRSGRWRRHVSAWKKCVSGVLFGVLSIPLALLAAGALASRGLVAMTMGAIAGIVVLAMVSLWLERQKDGNGILILTVATAICIIGDGLLGAPWMKHSVLGYDPMIGARYYGIGNEYMGALIGSIALGSASAMQAWHASANAAEAAAARPRLAAGRASWRRRTAAAAVFAAAFLAAAAWLAAPAGGANAGGALAAVVALGVAWARMCGGAAAQRSRLRARGLAVLAAGLLALGAALLWAVNAFATATPLPPPGSALGAAPMGGATTSALGSAPAALTAAAAHPQAPAGASHIGRAFALAEEGRWGEIALIAQRKLAMNARLIRVSVWSKVFLAALLVLLASVLRPWGPLRAWQRSRPYLTDGFTAIAFGSVAALLLNDSGIVAAAIMLVYAAVPMLMLLLSER